MTKSPKPGLWDAFCNGSKTNDAYWNKGLFECSSVDKDCLFSFCLPPIELLYQMKVTARYGTEEAKWGPLVFCGNCLCACFCFPCAVAVERSDLILRYDMYEFSKGFECFSACCCSCCALNQQAGEIKFRNEKPAALFME